MRNSPSYRILLLQGRFLSPYTVENGSAVNVAEINPLHGLICAGTDGGFVECFDPRVRERVGCVDIASRIPAEMLVGDGLPEVTAINCFGNGLTMAVGTSSGHVLMYDIRSARPELTKDHNNGLPIKTVTHHPESGNVISADPKGIKIWDEHTGENYTTLEASADINQVSSVCVCVRACDFPTAESGPFIFVIRRIRSTFLAMYQLGSSVRPSPNVSVHAGAGVCGPWFWVNLCCQRE